MGRKKTLTDWEEKHLCEWWVARSTVKGKCKQIGIHPSTLYQLLARHGLRTAKPRDKYHEKVRRYMRELLKDANERTIEAR